MKPTPGPWFVYDKKPWQVISTANGKPFVVAESALTPNATLIAAAPELYKTIALTVPLLESLIPVLELVDAQAKENRVEINNAGAFREVLRTMRLVLAKAEGGLV